MSETPAYYNNTNIDGKNLLEAIEAAQKQNDRIMVIFKAKNRPLSPSQVYDTYTAWFHGRTPITSIRRAMSNLSVNGLLEKTSEMTRGMYGKPEYKWRMPN